MKDRINHVKKVLAKVDLNKYFNYSEGLYANAEWQNRINDEGEVQEIVSPLLDHKDAYEIVEICQRGEMLWNKDAYAIYQSRQDAEHYRVVINLNKIRATVEDKKQFDKPESADEKASPNDSSLSSANVSKTGVFKVKASQDSAESPSSDENIMQTKGKRK